MDYRSTIPKWASWMTAAGRCPGTVTLRVRHVERFLDSHPDPTDLTALAEHISNPAWSPSTRRSVRASLHLWTSWLYGMDMIERDPMSLLPPIAPTRAVPRPCPDAVIRSVLATADRRLAALIHLGADAGLRRAEMVTVARTDLFPDLLGESLLIHGKGRRERIVPLSPAASSALHRQFQTVPDHVPWLFPSIGPWSHQHIGAIRAGEIINAALPSPWTAHTLRHRFATRAYRDSQDLLLVQHLMGHSKPETTAMYIHHDTSAARSIVHGISIDHRARSAPRQLQVAK